MIVPSADQPRSRLEIIPNRLKATPETSQRMGAGAAKSAVPMTQANATITISYGHPPKLPQGNRCDLS
jgi:hypothetical protein